MNMIHFSLFSATWNSARIRKHTQQSNWYQMPKPKVLFNTLQESSWVLFQFARVLKKVLVSMAIRFSCLSSQKINQKGEGRKEAYRQHRKWLLSLTGREGSVYNKTKHSNHSSLWPFSEGKTVPYLWAAPQVYKPGAQEKHCIQYVLWHISNNSTPRKWAQQKSFTQPK